MTEKFNRHLNYIGNAKWMYVFTGPIGKMYPEINFTAFKHDHHWKWILAEKNIIIRIVIKCMYDLMFLVLGIARNLLKMRPDGAVIVIVLYVILLLSTLPIIYIERKVLIDLSLKNGK